MISMHRNRIVQRYIFAMQTSIAIIKEILNEREIISEESMHTQHEWAMKQDYYM